MNENHHLPNRYTHYSAPFVHVCELKRNINYKCDGSFYVHLLNELIIQRFMVKVFLLQKNQIGNID